MQLKEKFVKTIAAVQTKLQGLRTEEYFKKLRTQIFSSASSKDSMIKYNTRLGLDIGAYSIKVILVKQQANELKLKNAVYKEIFEQADAPDSPIADSVVAQNLNMIWQKEKISERSVNLVISDANIYLRHIQFPRINEEELAKALRWQAEKYIPFPIEDAIVDYQMINEQSIQDPAKMDIALVAVPKKVIDKYLEILKAAKLTARMIDIAAFATAKVFMCDPAANSKELTAIIDIGHHSTNVVIIKGKSLRLVKNFEIGGQHMLQAIREGLGIESKAAERKLKEIGWPLESVGKDLKKYQAAISPILNEFTKHIERAFLYAEREHMTEHVSQVFLCGGAAALLGLESQLNQYFKIPVNHWEKLHWVTKHDKANSSLLTHHPYLFVPAIGAAI